MTATQMRLLATVALFLVWLSGAHGQAVTDGQSGIPQAAVAPATLTPAGNSDLLQIKEHLTSIEADINKLADRAAKPDYTPAVIGAIGVMIGAAISAFMNWRLMVHQRKLTNENATRAMQLAERRAKLEITNSFVQWQLKQLSELYGPLHALLRQSNSLYRHMNSVLVNADPHRFRLRQGKEGDDFDGMIFEICVNGDWSRFRTVMHVNEVYGRNYGIEEYFNGVVDIGGRIVKVITENAGYARPEQKELVAFFGKYLAHYSVLERLHIQVKEQIKSQPQGDGSYSVPASYMAVDKSAVFPQEIQTLVDTGFEAINSELNAWRAQAAA